MSRRPRGSRACDDATAQCDNDSDISVHPAPRPRDVCRVTGSSAVVWGHESRNDCGPLAQQGSSLSSALCSRSSEYTALTCITVIRVSGR